MANTSQYVSGTAARKHNVQLVNLLIQTHQYAETDGVPWYVRAFNPWKAARVYRQRLLNIARSTNPQPVKGS